MSANATIISFACDGCGRAFSVPAGYAGRKATCQTCGNRVVVPGATHAPRAEGIDAGASTNGDDRGDSNPGYARHAVASPGASNGENDVPTSDPATVTRRPARVAVISEAQSAPSASTVAPAPPDEAAAAHEQRSLLLGSTADRPAKPSRTSPKIPMRVRRLLVDAEQAAKAFGGNGPIRIKSTVGDPAELYQIEYHVTGLQPGWLGKPKKRATHLVEIQLTSEYPRVSPKCRMLTPVFHPNIDETTICVGDHWTAGERLVDLIVRIGEMLAYQDYNIKSPLNGEAAMWADLHPKKLPVDSRNLRAGEGESQ